MLLTKDDVERAGSVTLLKKCLHGGFLLVSDLNADQKRVCEDVDWIQGAVKYKCQECGSRHTAPKGETTCVRRAIPVSPQEVEEGYRMRPDIELELDSKSEYNIVIREHSNAIILNELPYKSIVFVPDKDSLEFSDRAGSVVGVPLDRLPELYWDEVETGLIDEIENKRGQLIDWGNLEPDGEDKFEEITYSLVERNEDYSNSHWGGSGPDQGKEAYCSVNQGTREFNVLVQAKFNNEGDAVNGSTVEKYCRKAARHDCDGLILSAVRTSGDLETEFYNGAFHTQGLPYFELWSGPEIKEMLSKHPDLIGEYFLS